MLAIIIVAMSSAILLMNLLWR